MINIEDIHFSYNGNAILKGVDLAIREGELHGIIGPNGAGKSTLLRIMAGLLPADKGSITVNNDDFTRVSPLERAKTLSFVFQENYTGFPYTVYEIVLLGRHPHQDRVLFDTVEDKRIADEALGMLNMQNFKHRLFRTLSGGEKQRVAISAAIAQRTLVILFDEPTAYTDLHYQSEIYRTIRNITKQKDLTAVVVTHNVNLASMYCDKVSVLHEGIIKATGRPADILTQELLRTTYGASLMVIKHPEEDAPLVVPVVREHGQE
jgi:iron complex transport system ATP-binding protein